jgi:hypothetical protein
MGAKTLSCAAIFNLLLLSNTFACNELVIPTVIKSNDEKLKSVLVIIEQAGLIRLKNLSNNLRIDLGEKDVPKIINPIFSRSYNIQGYTFNINSYQKNMNQNNQLKFKLSDQQISILCSEFKN